MKLTVTESVSLDGIMPGSADPTRTAAQDSSTEAASWCAWLLENELVVEINLLRFPVIIGEGTRLFADPGSDVPELRPTLARTTYG